MIIDYRSLAARAWTWAASRAPRLRPACGKILVATAVLIAAAPPESKAAERAPAAVAGSGLPIPRYVSLKSDRVNLRKGPSTEYPTSWVFRRAGLPLEVIKEFEGWREVRDADGVTGWVLQSFLSGRRTALVLPWEVKGDAPRPQVALKGGASAGSATVVQIEAGVIANIISCDRAWCYLTIEDFRGYLEQKKLWGVYEGEVLK